MTKRKNSQESVEKIANAALHLVAEKGYTNTSLEEIAQLAGFTKGAVYYFFKSKEMLLLKILEDIERRSIDHTAQEIENGSDGALDRLVKFINVQARWASAYPDDLAVLMLMSIESANQPSKIREKVSSIYTKMAKTLERIVTLGKRNGEFPAKLPVKDVVLSMIATHDGNMLLWYRSGRDPEVGKKLARAARYALIQKIKSES